jgi:hypothetical protein
LPTSSYDFPKSGAQLGLNGVCLREKFEFGEAETEKKMPDYHHMKYGTNI